MLNREMVITLITLETHGKLNLILDLLMALSRASLQEAHPMLTSLSICAKILPFMVPLVWLGLEHFVELTTGKDTKLPSIKNGQVLFQQLR